MITDTDGELIHEQWTNLLPILEREQLAHCDVFGRMVNATSAAFAARLPSLGIFIKDKSNRRITTSSLINSVSM